MTVVLGGIGSHGNFLISDAIVTMSDNSVSNKDCRIKDKITRLSGSKNYCAILGDENILFGIMTLDNWYDQHFKPLDFTNYQKMEEALRVAEKFVELFNLQDHLQATTNGGTIYFANQESFYEYQVRRENNKYSIIGFRHLSDTEVFINYGGIVERIEDFNFPLDSYFDEGCQFIETYHNDRKIKDVQCLKYDFDDKFSGVIYPKTGGVKIHLPFKNLTDFIASQADTPQLTWKLLNDEGFTWTPEL